VSALGLAALNALFLATGLALLFGLRGFATLHELLRLVGLAYLLGTASVTLALSLALVFGGSVSVAMVLAVVAVLTAAGASSGVRLGHPWPRRRGDRPPPERFRWLGLACAALTAAYLANLLRAARLQSQFVWAEWDVWNSWTTKAKTIYFFGGLDDSLYGTFAMPHPIFVPTLEAAAFAFMGAADTTLLHVQFWALIAGFVAAIAGLLRPAVPLAILWPFLLLLVVLPELNLHGLAPQADFALDVWFATAALCVALWVLRREPWLLVTAAVLLAAAMLTKREGLLLTFALLAGALVASWTTRRYAWPRLVGAFGAAFLVTLPWQLWRRANGLPSDATDASVSTALDRAGEATSSVAQILVRYDLWLLTVPLGLAAAALLLARGSWRLPALYLVTVAVSAAGFVWALAAVSENTLGPRSDENPIPRASGAVVLLTIALAPLMLARARGGRQDD
jgi:hypothetical protein